MGFGKIDMLEARPVDLQGRLTKWRALASALQNESENNDLKKGRLIGLDMSKYTCDESRCYAVKDGYTYFSDAHHLTFAATKLAIPDLEKLLAKR